MSRPLEKEFKYYLDNQDELVKKYKGKVIAIKNQKVIGVYDSEITAIQETSKNESLGTFLVQKCTLDKENYKQTYHSRVVFS